MIDIKEIRRVKGITQEHLALAMGVSVYTISRWERGVTPIPNHQAAKLKPAITKAVKFSKNHRIQCELEAKQLINQLVDHVIYFYGTNTPGPNGTKPLGVASNFLLECSNRLAQLRSQGFLPELEMRRYEDGFDAL